jgi:hypothetical protein
MLKRAILLLMKENTWDADWNSATSEEIAAIQAIVGPVRSCDVLSDYATSIVTNCHCQ